MGRRVECLALRTLGSIRSQAPNKPPSKVGGRFVDGHNIGA